jgi:nitrite reductase (cytochrome c-552)
MAEMGPAEFYKGKWASKGPEVVNFIGCADCHDPKTMDLRITRPALVEAFQALGRDISKATHQEMRSLVCAQCHVEYYFDKNRPDAKDIAYLTYPWKFGTSADSARKYFDSYGFTDFTHQLSKAPILKAQHPDYEVFITGIHAQRGVACADCHMPYVKEGGQKFTSHKITSPLSNIAGTCQVCHRESEETLRNNVYDRQRKAKELREMAEKKLVQAHLDAKAAWEAGAADHEMRDALQLIRESQWYWDYAVAGHGNAFHSPVETARLLGKSIDASGEARVKLAWVLALHGKSAPLTYPDLSTKEKAQQFIGLEMEKLRAEKEDFLKNIVPKWDVKR